VESIWKFKTSSRVAFFMWKTDLGKILDNLRKMNVIVVWCCMRKKSGESIDHLLLLCKVAELWSLHFQLFGVVWVMP
jgi:hypothetical protein